MEGKSPQVEGKGPKKFFKENFFEKSIDRSSFTATWTLDTVVKPFGTAVKNEVRNEFETSEKIWGYVAGEVEFENSGQEPLGHLKRAQNFFSKKEFEKDYRCVENTNGSPLAKP